MSEDLEEIFKCINEARVPSMWSKTYPSLKPLGSWTRDLVQRVDQVRMMKIVSFGINSKGMEFLGVVLV